MDTVYHRRSRILTQSHMWVAHKVDLWDGFLIQFIHTTTIYVCREDIGLLAFSLPSSNSSIKSSKGPKEEVFASQVANLKTCRWLRKTSAIMEGAWLLPTTALIFRSFTFPNAIQTFGQEAFFSGVHLAKQQCCCTRKPLHVWRKPTKWVHFPLSWHQSW